MNNAELIKALRCASHFALYQDCYEKNCYANSGKGLYCNIPKLMADAADALEAADEKIADCVASIDALDDSNDAYIKENERLKNRIAELEAQLPKEGEWIIDGAYTYNLRELNDKAYEPVYRCSCCNRQTESYLRLDEPKMPEDADFPEYCPHCGARMKTVTECHTLEEGER